MKLAQADIFGTIAPPTGAPTDLGNFTGGAIRIFIIVAGFALLIYLFWGAFDWITSGGDKEKLTKAQNKITQAIIGMILVVAALAIFQVIAGDVLHIIDTSGGGWKFNLPSL
ncbi:hypothetical protein A2774_04640 [Candidatus Roizmanbacteria bacterium RIFCSPHIGHO2_01_FULL_39_12c]|uniref:Uncharacterized protein n=1 Tax=Candidatus Roizmanbacteria bacterium RIFCSPHIGHO2_01_FULL_39_12c TaxID=1802031 RepID=A0A1F7GBJ2_9BACT|nr:MAG: hypothetical protein A2774_04640 [Candidatus Roizmanbacteria bacterium RIFCSPHIGHO2_01_FULL_39_12c]